jgi:hypothetical protein
MKRDLLEIKILVDKKIIVESLHRIGIADKKRKILYPSCYLFSKDGKDYLCHFKELFLLDEKKEAYDNISQQDIQRKNAIAFCLKNWGMIDVATEAIEPHDCFVFVLPHKVKAEWQIVHKFSAKLSEK